MPGPSRSSCQACRLSKTKCDLATCGSDQACARCKRLNLRCFPAVSSRQSGGPVVVQATPLVSPHAGIRLSPSALAANAAGIPLFDTLSEAWAQHKPIMLKPGRQSAGLWFLRSMFAVARRLSSWAATAECLKMAQDLDWSLDRALELLSLAHAEAQAPVGADLAMPEYVQEWFSAGNGAAAPCIARGEQGGVLRAYFNPPAVGVLRASLPERAAANAREFLEPCGGGCLRTRPLEAGRDTGLEVEGFLCALLTPGDLALVVDLWTRAWAQVDEALPCCHVELAGADAARLQMSGGGQSVLASIRVLTRRGGTERWEVYAFEPDLTRAPKRLLEEAPPGPVAKAPSHATFLEVPLSSPSAPAASRSGASATPSHSESGAHSGTAAAAPEAWLEEEDLPGEVVDPVLASLLSDDDLAQVAASLRADQLDGIVGADL